MSIPFNFAHLQAAFRLSKVLEGSKTNIGGKTPQITVNPSAVSFSVFLKKKKKVSTRLQLLNFIEESEIS